MFGIQTDLGHIPADASVQLEFSDPTDEDPIEWVNIHVRSSALPVFTEDREWDADADNTPGPVYTAREMLAREGGTAAEPEEEELDDVTVQADEVTVEDLKDMLREKDLPVSGTKAELIARVNAYDEMTVTELKETLHAAGLPVSGTKAELIERLVEGDGD
jgi:hypothetical protein